MKYLILILLIFFNPTVSLSQDVCLTLEEAKFFTERHKLAERLELKVFNQKGQLLILEDRILTKDSIISYQKIRLILKDDIIRHKNTIISNKEKQIEVITKEHKRKKRKLIAIIIAETLVVILLLAP